MKPRLTMDRSRDHSTERPGAHDHRDHRRNTPRAAGAERHQPGEATGRLAEEGILDHLRHHYKTADWTTTDVIDRITQPKCSTRR